MKKADTANMLLSMSVKLGEKPVFCPVSKSISKTSPTNNITNTTLVVSRQNTSDSYIVSTANEFQANRLLTETVGRL